MDVDDEANATVLDIDMDNGEEYGDEGGGGVLNSGHASDKLLLPSWMHRPNHMSKDSGFYAERKKWTETSIRQSWHRG